VYKTQLLIYVYLNKGLLVKLPCVYEWLSSGDPFIVWFQFIQLLKHTHLFEVECHLCGVDVASFLLMLCRYSFYFFFGFVQLDVVKFIAQLALLLS